MPYVFKGVPIFKQEVFRKLCSNLDTLLRNGYIESKSKPGLFYRPGNNKECYFADMRGTDFVPIWNDTSPLFYVRFLDGTPRWLASRLATAEFRRLRICRISNEFDSESGYAISVPELGIYMSNGNAGYCENCGKDFSGDGEFCSRQCSDESEEKHAPHCKVCQKRLTFSEGDRHHLNYTEDITILVCRSCHLRIHRGNVLNEYKPLDMRVPKE